MHAAARYRELQVRSVARILALALIVVCLGCRTARPARSSDSGPLRTTIDVQNADFNDMTVYVLVNGARIRLGIAPGHATTVLTIPANLLGGTTYLRFVANPIAGHRTPVTEEIDVNPGDELVMVISPGR